MSFAAAIDSSIGTSAFTSARIPFWGLPLRRKSASLLALSPKQRARSIPPYFWGIFTDKGERESMLKNGWKSVGKVFILAIVLDVVYQIIEHRWTVYPGEAVLVALVLAIVPYLLIRGPVNRIVCHQRKVEKERLAGD
jgi:hypothetical protein